jgi:hypothetical protein
MNQQRQYFQPLKQSHFTIQQLLIYNPDEKPVFALLGNLSPSIHVYCQQLSLSFALRLNIDRHPFYIE